MKRGYIESRRERFAQRIQTRITKEFPSKENPFVPEKVVWSGHDLFELIENESFLRVVFLLIKGKFPTEQEARLLESVFVLMANRGPRHAATRAALTAAATKTTPENWLPIGLAVLGGKYGGAGEVESSMRFIRANHRRDTKALASELAATALNGVEQGTRVAPGFGRHFGGRDTFARSVGRRLKRDYETRYLSWAMQFGEDLEKFDSGILFEAVAGAAFLDLGFHPRVGPGLAQMAGSAGILAHAFEYSGKSLRHLPMVDEEHYRYVGPED